MRPPEAKGAMIREFAKAPANKLSLEQITVLLQSDVPDMTVLWRCYERLIEILPSATPAEKLGFYRSIQGTSARCAGADDGQDSAFRLATLMAAMGFYEDAIIYYTHSQLSTGNTANT